MTLHINLGEFKSYVSRNAEGGRELRKELDLDDIDNTSQVVIVDIPLTFLGITSSFFLEMFGPSIIKAGSAGVFLDKYLFKTNGVSRGVINRSIERALMRQKWKEVSESRREAIKKWDLFKFFKKGNPFFDPNKSFQKKVERITFSSSADSGCYTKSNYGKYRIIHLSTKEVKIETVASFVEVRDGGMVHFTEVGNISFSFSYKLEPGDLLEKWDDITGKWSYSG